MGEVVAIVVTFNRKKLLIECLEALLGSERKCDILIVDNGSDDGTRDSIKKYINRKNIHYFNTGKNIGGAGGFNYGMKKAYEMGYEFFWLMDDDCIVKGDSLSELMKANDELGGEYGFLSSKVLWRDGSISKMNIPKRTFSKWLKDYNEGRQRIAMASFVSFFTKKNVVQQFGYPIKEFFIWTDDWEYSRRISRKMPCYYISKSVVVHKSSSNDGARIDTADDRLERFSYPYRNDVYLYNREGIKGKILLKLRIMLHSHRVHKSDKKDKMERIAIMKKALEQGKDFKPVIEYPKYGGEKG